MKISHIVPAIALFATLACSTLFAQDLSCIDKAQSNGDAEKCGSLLITPAEKKVDAEFKRISAKYKGNEKMQEIIRNTKQSWNDYRNNQCMFEGTAASGGQSGKPISLEANKVFLKCAVRTLTEMQTALGKF
jgi:uncharacterized protein YecT (DUF1311 family)